MKINPTKTLATLIFLFATVSLPAQKHIEDYAPEALFKEGVLLFRNQEYGAALSAFGQYRAHVADAKAQRCVDAQYYEAVSALYLGHADGPAKVMQFVNDNPGSTWARHANFLYANHLFQNKNYKEALAIYVSTDATSLTIDEAQQMQFNMGYAYFQTGETDKAMPLFHGLMMNEGKYQEPARYYYAHIQYIKEKYDEALGNFRRLRSHSDYAKVVPAYIMQIDYLKGDYQSVIEEGPGYIQQADKKRKSEMAQIVADAYFQQKDYDKTLEYYDIYKRNLSRGMSREAYYQMGVSKMMKGDHKRAVADLQKIAGNNDILAQYASYYLGSCYAKADEMKYARSAFYNAYSAGFDPELSEEALFDYARLSLIPGADPFNEAVGLLDNYIAEHPALERKAEAEEMSIYLLLNAKEHEEALKRLEAMKKKSRELQTVYNELLYATGIDNFQKGNYDKAQVYFSKIMNGRHPASNKALACFWMGESSYQISRQLPYAVQGNARRGRPARTQARRLRFGLHLLPKARLRLGRGMLQELHPSGRRQPKRAQDRRLHPPRRLLLHGAQLRPSHQLLRPCHPHRETQRRLCAFPARALLWRKRQREPKDQFAGRLGADLSKHPVL